MDQPQTDIAAPAPITSRHVAKGVGTTMIARLGGVIEIVTQPLYVALFGLASFGLYTALWAAVNLIENVADLGMTSAMQRTVPRARDEREAASALRASVVLGVLPCIAIALIVSIAAPALAPVFNSAAKDEHLIVPAIRLFIWALPLWAFVEIATSALRAKRLFGPEIRLRTFWEQVVRVMLALLFWAFGMGLSGLFLAHLLSLTVTSVLAIRLLSKHFSVHHFFHGRLFDEVGLDTTKAGFATLPTNIVQQIFTDGPPLLLNIMLPGAAGATSSALYGIARKIASVIQMFRTAFAYVLAPLAAAATRGAEGEVRTLYAYATRLTTATVMPLALVMAAAGPAILHVFGKQAQVALPALIILFGARMIEATTGGAKPVQQVVGGYRRQLASSIIGLALALAVGAVTVPLFALTGMAIAVGTGIVSAAVIPLFQLWRHEHMHPFETPFMTVLLRATLVALGGGAIAMLANFAPEAVRLVLLVPVLLGSIWLSMRIALPLDDRMSLGRKTVKKLRLI